MNYFWEKIFTVYYYITDKFYPPKKEEPIESISREEKERIAQIRIEKFTPMKINKPKNKYTNTVRKDQQYEQMMRDWFS